MHLNTGRLRQVFAELSSTATAIMMQHAQYCHMLARAHTHTHARTLARTHPPDDLRAAQQLFRDLLQILSLLAGQLLAALLHSLSRLGEISQV